MGIKNRFALGEIDQWNWGQYDGDEYQLAVAWLENFQVLPQGGLNRRRGYERLKALSTTAEAVRLVHIVANNKDYVLALMLDSYGVFDCVSKTCSKQNYSVNHPAGVDTLNEMRYCTRKNVAVFVSSDCRPFYIRVEATGATTHGLISITNSVTVVETKPEEFTKTNSLTVYDNNAAEIKTQNPRVIAYVANRIWLAHTSQNPNKIWVSKRTDDITNIDMSTYNIYSTISEEYLAFSGRNIIGESTIDKLDGNGHLMREYAVKVLKDAAPTTGNSVNGSRVNYGVDPVKLNKTSYFMNGGSLSDAPPDLKVSAASVAVEEEYTDAAIAQTESEYTKKMNMFAARDLRYVAPGGLISANCYGVEIFVVAINPKVSVESGYYKGGISSPGWGFEGETEEVKTEGDLLTKVSSTASVGTGTIAQPIAILGALAGTAAGAIELATVPPVSVSVPTLSVSSQGGGKVTGGKTTMKGGETLDSEKDGSISDESEGKVKGASFGTDVVIQQLVPFTAWGDDWDTTAIKAAAAIQTASAVFAGGAGAMLLSVAPDIAAAGFATDVLFFASIANLLAGPDIDAVRDKMKTLCKDNLKLTVELLKEGRVMHDVSAVGLSPGSDVHPDYLTNILQYIKTKYSLYSKLQPFMGIYHKLKVEEYSTADCGFTFSISGGTGEFITDIQENQDIMILTTKSERMADYTINGENQLVRKIGSEGSEFVKSTLTGSALYMMRSGYRSMQKLQWQPAMNAPSVIQTNQRNSVILNDFYTRFLYASETYPKKVRLISGKGEVVGVQLLLGTEAFYRETTYGEILDMQSFKVGQDENVYAARKDANGKVWLDVLVDSIGNQSHIFLDSWSKNGKKDDYDNTAVLYDKKNDRVYWYKDTIPEDVEYYIGYPYMSKVRTLPAVGFGDMRQVRLPRVKIRLMDSCMPFVNGYPEGDELNPNIITDQQDRRSGVFNVPVPGTNNCDAAYEIYTTYPDSLSILAIYEENV